MRKVIFGIFAHPDDEAFGPSGALLMETLNGSDVHLTTLTIGEAGMNPDDFSNLGAIRYQEWQQASKLIGAKSTTCFDYQDGQLNNQDMLEIGQKLVELVQEKTANQDDLEIEFMTSDLNGISGHIDHIVAARAAAWAFYTLKAKDSRLTRIRFACVSREAVPEQNVNWLFMEAGHLPKEIDETVDARHLNKEIKQIMRAHYTQRLDGENHIKNRGDSLGLYHFITKN